MKSTTAPFLQFIHNLFDKMKLNFEETWPNSYLDISKRALGVLRKRREFRLELFSSTLIQIGNIDNILRYDCHALAITTAKSHYIGVHMQALVYSRLFVLETWLYVFVKPITRVSQAKPGWVNFKSFVINSKKATLTHFWDKQLNFDALF